MKSFVEPNLLSLFLLTRSASHTQEAEQIEGLCEEIQCHAETSYTLFSQPFNDLLVWSVLTKRQSMAKLMWQHGEEALAKALMASNLYRAMATEAADDDLEVEISDELSRYAVEFDHEALELLDYCYRQDDDLAQQLLTCELSNWSRQTCLRLAFACNHRELLARPCSQLILGDLWLGGLRTRRSTNLKILLGLFCPPLILHLEFKSKEELQLMPQTEEERMTELKDELNSSVCHTDQHSSFSPSPTLSTHSEHIVANKMKHIGKVKFAEEGEDGHFHTSDCDFPTMKFEKQAENLSVSQDHINPTRPACSTPHNRKRQLRFTKKLYEFYTAPITKFWSWSIAYIVFLLIYTYTLLIRTPLTPEWNEWYVVAHMASFGCEKLREILASEPVNLKLKFAVWSSQMWNCLDAFFVLEFFVGFLTRLHDETFDHGRVLYCLNIIYW